MKQNSAAGCTGVVEITGSPKATLRFSEHGFDDYDVVGMPVVRRVTVGHGIKKGDLFNVYCDDDRKIGGIWQGTLEASLASVAERLGLADETESGGSFRKPFEPKWPEEIWLNDALLIKGNHDLGVIYNNLVGLNFTDDTEYGAYMAYMAKTLGFSPLQDGDRFEFRSHGLVVTRYVVGSGVATRVTDELICPVLKKNACG